MTANVRFDGLYRRENSGMGELHLDIIVDRMKREFSVQANVGEPQVAFRETIRKAVEIEGKFIRQSGGRGQYGHCWLKIEPQEMGDRGNVKFVKGTVPLSTMFGYATAMRSISQGRAAFTMEPSHYEQVPSNVQTAIVEKRGMKKVEEK